MYASWHHSDRTFVCAESIYLTHILGHLQMCRHISDMYVWSGNNQGAMPHSARHRQRDGEKKGQRREIPLEDVPLKRKFHKASLVCGFEPSFTHLASDRREVAGLRSELVGCIQEDGAIESYKYLIRLKERTINGHILAVKMHYLPLWRPVVVTSKPTRARRGGRVASQLQRASAKFRACWQHLSEGRLLA